MLKKQLLSISIILIFIFCLTGSTTIMQSNAQVVDSWTWISGNDIINVLGVYGDKGIEHPANRPGARYGHASWIDNDGNLWIFGGRGFNNDTTLGYLSDLWKYSVSTNNWVWMAGSHLIDQVRVYGTRGVFHANNHPGGRHVTGFSSDRDGHLWVFGGETVSGSKRADLWCYNTTEEAWAWIAGNDVDDYEGNFSTYRVYEFYNRPPARAGTTMWSGILYDIIYVFGGYDYASAYRNDLWAYSLQLDNWAWVSGSNLTEVNGFYGPIEDENPSYYPGARAAMSSWITKDGYMWIFGGYGRDSTGTVSYLNDLWRYNVTTDAWAWMTGSNYTDQAGSYGIKGQYGSFYTPGARSVGASCLDSYGNPLLFGGATGIGLRFNDLWQYNQTINQWRWMSGNYTTNVLGNYGTKGITDISSYPGARQAPTIRCGNNGEIWMFGGYGYGTTVTSGYLNDLWIYVPLDLVIINEFSKITLIPIITFVSILTTMLIKRRRQ